MRVKSVFGDDIDFSLKRLFEIVHKPHIRNQPHRAPETNKKVDIAIVACVTTRT